MTGNGEHTTYKNGDDLGMVYDCFDHLTHKWRHFNRDNDENPLESAAFYQTNPYGFEVQNSGSNQQVVTLLPQC